MLSIHHLLSFALICQSFTSDKTGEKHKDSPNRDEVLGQALQSYRFVCLSLAGGPIFSDVIWPQRYCLLVKAVRIVLEKEKHHKLKGIKWLSTLCNIRCSEILCYFIATHTSVTKAPLSDRYHTSLNDLGDHVACPPTAIDLSCCDFTREDCLFSQNLFTAEETWNFCIL